MHAIVIRWSGPFDFERATEVRHYGIYAVWGRNRMGRAPSMAGFRYCGISEHRNGVGARVKQHRDEPFNHSDNHWWIGQVHLPQRNDREHLELAEWGFVRGLQPEHNEKKKWTPPPTDCYLINEWYTADDNRRERRRQTGFMGFVPDVMCWDAHNELWRYARRLSQ